MSSLKRKSAVALAWDYGGLLVNRGSGFIISIFLARLLSPEEFGLVGMAMVFIAISQVFIDVGFASALIQRKESSDLTYSSVFYFNILSGLILTAVFYFFAPFIGHFYENSEVTDLVRWLSLSFLFSSLNRVQAAILTKQLNFRVLTIRNVIASVVSGVFGVIAAFQGLGVYALVIQTLSNAVMSTILLWSISSWKPSLLFSFTELKKLMGFSIYIFFDAISAKVFEKLDVLFIGKVFSSSTLGLYTRAESFSSLVNTFTTQSLKKVAFPVLSSVSTEEERFKRIFSISIESVVLLSFTLTGCLYLFGSELIILLFGDQWIEAIPMFEILILRSASFPLNVILLNALISKGYARKNFYYGLLRKSFKASLLFIAYFYGLIPFLWSFLIFHYLMTILNNYWVSKSLVISQFSLLRLMFLFAIPIFIIIIFNERMELFFGYKIGILVIYLMINFAIAYLTKNKGLYFLFENFKQKLH